jgi:urease alpha subunit
MDRLLLLGTKGVSRSVISIEIGNFANLVPFDWQFAGAS